MTRFLIPLLLPLCLALPVLADTLQPLGDEFEEAATFSRYQEHGALEGWGSSHIETADVNTTSPGHFRIVPRTTGWYEHLRGTHFSKNVTGDFVATAHVFVYSRQNPSGPLFPSIRLYSLGGILAREPRNITHAAPVPYTTSAVWPPQDFGSDWTPGDETWANTSELIGKGENYLFLSLGTAGNSGTRQFEIKTTRRSRSELYFSSNGIAGAHEAWLQMVRVGNTMVCLRRHGAGGPWIVENRYPNPDHAFPQFGATLQVGITAYTDFNSVTSYEAGGPTTQFHCNYIAVNGQPDLILDVDYLRLQRPSPALTEAVLQGMSTSYNPATNTTAASPVLLTASPAAAPYLGANADVPLGRVGFSASSVTVNEGQGSATLQITRTGNSLSLPLSLSCTVTPLTAAAGTDYTATSAVITWEADQPASKTFLVPLLTDSAVEGPEQFHVTLSGLDGPATFAASAPTVTALVTVEDSLFDQWRGLQFGAAANSALAQATADFDNDGVPNLMEYALDGNAAAPDHAILPHATSAGGQLTFIFQRRLAAADLLLEVQSGNDLDEWTTIASKAGAAAWDVQPGATINDPGTGTVAATAAGPFMRLRVTRP